MNSPSASSIASLSFFQRAHDGQIMLVDNRTYRLRACGSASRGALHFSRGGVDAATGFPQPPRWAAKKCMRLLVFPATFQFARGSAHGGIDLRAQGLWRPRCGGGGPLQVEIAHAFWLMRRFSNAPLLDLASTGGLASRLRPGNLERLTKAAAGLRPQIEAREPSSTAFATCSGEI